jgi:hypothetical protein
MDFENLSTETVEFEFADWKFRLVESNLPYYYPNYIPPKVWFLGYGNRTIVIVPKKEEDIGVKGLRLCIGDEKIYDVLGQRNDHLERSLRSWIEKYFKPIGLQTDLPREYPRC